MLRFVVVASLCAALALAAAAGPEQVANIKSHSLQEGHWNLMKAGFTHYLKHSNHESAVRNTISWFDKQHGKTGFPRPEENLVDYLVTDVTAFPLHVEAHGLANHGIVHIVACEYAGGKFVMSHWDLYDGESKTCVSGDAGCSVCMSGQATKPKIVKGTFFKLDNRPTLQFDDIAIVDETPEQEKKDEDEDEKKNPATDVESMERNVAEAKMVNFEQSDMDDDNLSSMMF